MVSPKHDPKAPAPAPTPTKPQGSIVPGQAAGPATPNPPAGQKRDTADAPNQSSGAADGNRSTQSHQGGLPPEERADQDGDGSPDPEVGDRPTHEGDPLALKPDDSTAADEAFRRGDEGEARLPGRADTPPTTRQTGSVKTVPTIPAGPPDDADPDQPPGNMRHPTDQGRDPGRNRPRAPKSDPAADYWGLVQSEAGVKAPHRTANVLAGVRPAIFSAAGKTDADFATDVITTKQRYALRDEMGRVTSLESRLQDAEQRQTADAIGGPRFAARAERIGQLKAEILRLKGAKKSLVESCPREDLQARRRELLKDIHGIDGQSIREGISEGEADRRTAEERAELAEIEDEMAAV